MLIEVEKLNAHGLANKDKILCQVSKVDDQGANAYRPTFTVPAEGFLTPVAGKDDRFTVQVAEDGQQPAESKTVVVKIMSVDGSKAGASIRVHRAFVRDSVIPA